MTLGRDKEGLSTEASGVQGSCQSQASLEGRVLGWDLEGSVCFLGKELRGSRWWHEASAFSARS